MYTVSIWWKEEPANYSFYDDVQFYGAQGSWFWFTRTDEVTTYINSDRVASVDIKLKENSFVAPFKQVQPSPYEHPYEYPPIYG